MGGALLHFLVYLRFSDVFDEYFFSDRILTFSLLYIIAIGFIVHTMQELEVLQGFPTIRSPGF